MPYAKDQRSAILPAMWKSSRPLWTARIELRIGAPRLQRTASLPASSAPLGDSSTVEPRTLTPLILVRIQVPQPLDFKRHFPIEDETQRRQLGA